MLNLWLEFQIPWIHGIAWYATVKPNVKPNVFSPSLFFLSYRHGNIKDLGPDAEIENRYAKSSFERVLDVSGKTIVPGLVDAHTHPVWAGDRVHEFAMKVRISFYILVYWGVNLAFFQKILKQNWCKILLRKISILNFTAIFETFRKD